MSNLTKVAVVTGSNKGIGLSIIRGLCNEFQGDVILTARDEVKGQDAVQLLQKEGLQPKFHLLDIDSLDSIIRFRDFLKTTYGGLNVLINNAAIIYKTSATEPFWEMVEVTNRVNFTGTLNISNELFPLLRPLARVVNVSSSAGFLGKLNGQEPQSTELRKQFADPNLTEEELVVLVSNFVRSAKEGNPRQNGWLNEQRGLPYSAYVVSKVAVSALTRIQQRLIDEQRPEDNILINAVNPGYCATDLTGGLGPLTTEQGAVAPLWLALLPNNVTSPRGGYVWYRKEIIDWVNGPLPSDYKN